MGGVDIAFTVEFGLGPNRERIPSSHPRGRGASFHSSNLKTLDPSQRRLTATFGPLGVLLSHSQLGLINLRTGQQTGTRR